jgi:beta-lactamase class C
MVALLIGTAAGLACGTDGGGAPVASTDAGDVGASGNDAGNGLDGGDASQGAQVLWQETLKDLEQRRVAGGFPGMGVAIVIDGKLAFSGGLGVRSQKGQQPVTGETLFRSSSVASKTILSATILDLAEDGLVDVNAPVASLVPSMQLDPVHAAQINLHLLMSHRSGLGGAWYRGSNTQGAPPLCGVANAGVLDYITESGAIASLAPPDTVFLYSAWGSVAAAAAIENVTKKPFTEAVRDRIFVPAGMKTATFDRAAAVASNHAVGHIGTVEDDLDAAGSMACGEAVASEGVLASPEDHAHYLEMLLGGAGPLKAASLDELTKNQGDPGYGPTWHYGYHAFSLDYKGVKVLSHMATSGGYSGGLSWVPARKFGVVLLTNAQGTTARMRAIEEARYAILDRFLALTGAPPANMTPPSAWSKYVGTYQDTVAPGAKYTVALDNGGHLTLAIDPGVSTPAQGTQGFADSPYTGGDTFEFGTFFGGGFFGESAGQSQYLAGGSTIGGYHYFVAKRQ